MIGRKAILLTMITCGAGALTGIVSAKKNKALGALLAASAGAVAGYSAAMLCRKLQEEDIDYYTELSPFYKDDESFEYI